ncbi:MAG: hypothetical protein F2806_01710, partial [Actinobacteria bacterium]|nr:hypothetical protein [Actinomycetota bacterium]
MTPSRPSKTRAKTRGLFLASLVAAVCSLALVGFAGFSGALGLSAANAVPDVSPTGAPTPSSTLDASVPPGQERYIVATTQSNTDAATQAVVDAGGFIVAQYQKSIVGFAATMTPAAAATLA